MEDKNVHCLAVTAAKCIIGRYGWNNKAVREMAWGEGYPHSLQQVKHLVGMSLVDVLVLFIEAGLNDEEAALAIYDAACEQKCFLEREDGLNESL